MRIELSEERQIELSESQKLGYKIFEQLQGLSFKEASVVIATLEHLIKIYSVIPTHEITLSEDSQFS